jgi:hypothetical protein
MPVALPDVLEASRHVLQENFAGHSALKYAFLGGSLVADLQHAMSDVDVHVVVDDDPEQYYRTYRHAGLAVQINPMRLDEAEHFAGFAESYRVSSRDRAQLSLGELDLGRLVRFAMGPSLMVSDDFEPVLKRFDANVVRQLVVMHHAGMAAGLAEDAFGALASQDWYTALTASAMALERGAETLLAGAGDYYVGPKFLYRRLTRNPVTRGLVDRVWELRHHTVPSTAFESAAAAIVRERLDLACAIAAEAVLDGWFAPLDRPVDPTVAGSGPRRDPHFFLLRYSDGFALSGLRRAMKMSEPIARVWATLNGTARNDLPAALRSSQTTLADRSDEDILGAVQKLVECGAAFDGD